MFVYDKGQAYIYLYEKAIHYRIVGCYVVHGCLQSEGDLSGVR